MTSRLLSRLQLRHAQILDPAPFSALTVVPMQWGCANPSAASCWVSGYSTGVTVKGHCLVLLALRSACQVPALQAVYAYQGPELQKKIAELQRAVLDAQQVLDTTTEQLESLDVVCSLAPTTAHPIW